MTESLASEGHTAPADLAPSFCVYYFCDVTLNLPPSLLCTFPPGWLFVVNANTGAVHQEMQYAEQQGQIVENMVYADLTGGRVAPYSLVAGYLSAKMCR